MSTQTVAPEDRLLTPANVVTLVRICLVPVFILVLLSPWPEWLGLAFITNESKSLIATIVFVIISCTDWIDGYLARSRNEVTNFGKFVDPLADKILVAAALLALIELDVLPSWPVLIILAREFIVSGVRMIAASRGEVIAASWYGKSKTVLQIIAIILFLIKDGLSPLDSANPFDDPLYLLSWVVMGAALIMTVVSMLDYLSKARHLIGFAPQSERDRSGKSKSASSPKSTVPSEQKLHLEAVEAASKLIAATATKNITVSTAESLTAGMITSHIASVPGSSAVLKGGIVSYVNEVKATELGVNLDMLARDGAVNESTAKQMAEGARKTLASDIAVAVTGIAGPTGSEPGKPVGTVWFAVSSARGTQTQTARFDGNRNQVRLQTTVKAINMLVEEARNLS